MKDYKSVGLHNAVTQIWQTPQIEKAALQIQIEYVSTLSIIQNVVTDVDSELYHFTAVLKKQQFSVVRHLTSYKQPTRCH